VAFGIACGVCSIVCAIIGEELKTVQIIMSLASAFCSCAALNVLQIYTTELFPTCVRISATSMFRQAINFGPIFVPLLVSAARRNNSVVYGVFGSVEISCIFFVIFLPETRGLSLSNAMDEQEKKDNANAYVS
jgi:MFS family permease